MLSIHRSLDSGMFERHVQGNKTRGLIKVQLYVVVQFWGGTFFFDYFKMCLQRFVNAFKLLVS
jgi:hypothetical protein